MPSSDISTRTLPTLHEFFAPGGILAQSPLPYEYRPGQLEMAKAVERGHPAVFTADGPRGPVYKVKPGAVKLAQLTGYSIGIFYAHPEKAWLLRSWDQFMIPKPFSRVAISWGRQVQVPHSEDPTLIEAKRLEVEEALVQMRG